MSNKSNGRTLNIPKILPAGQVPCASYNGAITIGKKCVGQHCSIPVKPTSAYMTNVNLRSAKPPPGALTQYSNTFRLGNNTEKNPGIVKYGEKYNIEVQPNNIPYLWNTTNC